MHSSAQPQDRGRGVDLLLHHLSALDVDAARPPAYDRLVAAVGPELARMLVNALAADRGRLAPRLYAA